MRNILLGLLLLLSILPLGIYGFMDDHTLFRAAAHATLGYALWAAWIPVLLGLFMGEPRLTAVGLVPALLATCIVGAGHLARPAAGEPTLRVLTANVLMVNPDHDAVLGELARSGADLLLLEEVNHAWAAALSTELLRDYPYRLVEPQDGSFGIAILSRTPVTFSLHDLGGVPLGQAEIRLQGRTATISVVHTLPPRTDAYTQRWHDQMAALAQLGGGPRVIAGDLNATRFHPSYRRLLRAGLRDAHALVGRASAKTWPNGIFPVPPMRLDHVLVSPEWQVHGVRELPANGSDHAPVVADLSLR